MQGYGRIAQALSRLRVLVRACKQCDALDLNDIYYFVNMFRQGLLWNVAVSGQEILGLGGSQH